MFCPASARMTARAPVRWKSSGSTARVSGGCTGPPRRPTRAGVVCAKVARYAERQHHPDRLSQPLRRIGDKGVGRAAFVPISWDAALDEVAEQLTRAARRHGSEAVWPYYYSGTMGLVQRDGINRLRHAMRYSREELTICNMLSDTGWFAGVGVKRGVDGREMAKADLIVVWGGNPVSTQVNVMTHIATARQERGAKLVVIDPYRTASAEAADLHLAPLPGTDGALACAVMHVLFKRRLCRPRLHGALYRRSQSGSKRIWRPASPAWAAAITGLSEDEIIDFARLYGRSQAQLHPRRLRLFALAQRLGAAVRGDLPAGGDRRVAVRRRRRAPVEPRPRPARPHPDRRARRPRSDRSASSTSRASARC